MFGTKALDMGMLYLLIYLLCSPLRNSVGPSHVYSPSVSGTDAEVEEIDGLGLEAEAEDGGLNGKSPMCGMDASRRSRGILNDRVPAGVVRVFVSKN